MDSWQNDLKLALAQTGSCVLVTIARVKGSSPREAGAKMVVWPEGFSGSIGGGNLEFLALDRARALMAQPDSAGAQLSEIPLGPSLGQCCGGSVSLLFEAFGGTLPAWLAALDQARAADRPVVLATRLAAGRSDKQLVEAGGAAGTLEPKAARAAATLLARAEPQARLIKQAGDQATLLELLAERDPVVLLFGAGHVGRALAPLLAELPFRLTWIDERPEEFPDPLPAGLAVQAALQPPTLVERAPPGAIYLVMTHSHQRDLEVCERVLARGDFAYLGLIGSATKRARFVKRLREAGFSEAQVGRLTCPIGIPGVGGKKPAEIAVAVAAQLLQLRGQGASDV